MQFNWSVDGSIVICPQKVRLYSNPSRSDAFTGTGFAPRMGIA